MRVKGIKPVTVRAGGKTYRYFYHRTTGSRIAAEFGTAAFAAEVAALDQKAKATEPRDGSLHALIVAYKRSPEFTLLAARTKSDYGKVFDWLKPIGDMPLIEIDSSFVYELRDRVYRSKKRRFANYVVQVLRLLLEWGRQRKWIEDNPAREVRTISRPKGLPRANRPWTDEEREAVLSAAPIQLRAVVALGMFAGLREGDACAAPKAAFDGTTIQTVASKNGEPLWLPAHFRLREILVQASIARRQSRQAKAAKSNVLPIEAQTLAITSRGKCWTQSGFRASFFKLLKKLQNDGRVAPGLTFHGLRHTLGKLVIEAGGTRTDVGMLIGDRSEAMAALYSREHEKKGRMKATMKRLERIERGKMAKRTDRIGKKKNDDPLSA